MGGPGVEGVPREGQRHPKGERDAETDTETERKSEIRRARDRVGGRGDATRGGEEAGRPPHPGPHQPSTGALSSSDTPKDMAPMKSLREVRSQSHTSTLSLRSTSPGFRLLREEEAE